MLRRDLLKTLVGLGVSCGRDERDAEPRAMGKIPLVFKHQPLWGDPKPFRELLAAFERAHPDAQIVTEALPNASDLAHQYFLTALEGGARDFDVFAADVVWVPEFARAGWIADLSDAVPPDTLRREFLSGAAEAVLIDDHTFAVPWYVDVGVLYYRSDLVPPPGRYVELVASASDVRRTRAGMHGYVWQGRQYEGLVCNVYEAIWGHGGASMRDGRLLLDTPEAREALAYLRSLVADRTSPASVTSMAEEEARRVFQEGGAVFMRNWPYAWGEAQRESSPVRGKVGMATLPSTTGAGGDGTLGGFQLALNAHTPAFKRELALAFITHMTSAESNVALALSYSRNPARRAPYDDPRLAAGAPFVAQLLPMVERARPRPVTPYYPMISDAMQGEFSAAISGIRAPAAALARAQAQVDHVMRGGG